MGSAAFQRLFGAILAGGGGLPSFALPAQSFSTVSGSPTSTTVNGDPVLQLADAATTEIARTFNPEIGVGYDCYLYMSGAAATTGRVMLAHDVQSAASGVTPTPGPNKLFAIQVGAQNVVQRYQIPAGVLRPDSSNPDYRLRLQRVGADGSDNYAGAISIHRIEYVPTTVINSAAVTDSGAITPTVYASPYDGVAVQRGLSIYTPIWTSTDAVYLAESVTIATVQQSRLAKLDKTTYATIQNTQLATNTHDSFFGHRDASVAVDSAGTVIAHRQAHHTPFAGARYPGGDLTAGVAIAIPNGLANNCSYRRFFRNPFNGDIWLGVRGEAYTGYIYKWGTTTFSNPLGGFQQIAGSFGQLVGAYGLEMAFAAATTIYLLLEPIRVASGAASGYPRQNVNVIKSTDAGVTWSTMSGKAMTTNTPAFTPGGDDDVAFPSYNNGHNVVCGRIAVGADLQPIAVAAWRHPNETLRSLWAAKFDAGAQRWVRQRLLANDGVNNVGNPHLIYTADGKVIVSAATTDDHSTAGAEIVPANNQLYLFVTTDSAATWRRYALQHAAGGYGGAYLDPESVRIDNVLRMTPRNESVPTKSEVWVTAVPA